MCTEGEFFLCHNTDETNKVLAKGGVMKDAIYKLIERELESQKNLQKQYRVRGKKLEKYRGMSLKVSRQKGHNNYYYAHRKGEPYHYLGGEENIDVKSIKELRICDAMIQRLAANSELMENFLKSYKSMEFSTVMAELPKQYQRCNFEEEQGDAIRQRYIKMKEYKETVPVKHPETLKITAFDGTLVRSRAEAMIYGRLRAMGFYVIYEYPIEYEKGKYVFSDFLLIHPVTGQIIIIEHLGRWFYEGGKNIEYRNSYLWKTDIFRQIGFIQGVNFYVTFEENSNMDLEKITKDLTYLYDTQPTRYAKELEKRQRDAFADAELFRN